LSWNDAATRIYGYTAEEAPASRSRSSSRLSEPP
jgi:PAS domain-containing protein